MRPTAKKTLRIDEILFSQGEPGDCAFIIEKGRILIYFVKDQEEIPLSILGEGEIFGEMSLIDNQNRSASAKALDECILHFVTRDQLMERIDGADTIVRLLMRVLLKRMRQNTSLLTGNKSSTQQSSKTPAQDDNKQALDQIKLENEIYDAYNNNEFHIYYQGIYKTETQKILGCEALLRWVSPTKGNIATNTFIDIIESSSMILPVGYWILEECFRDLKSIQTELILNQQNDLAEDFSMSVNISGKQFNDPGFIDQLEKIREKHNVNSKHIKLEMTERIMMDGTVALETLKKCRALGYGISIDDFGTGFSSLQYLTKMPITHLKVDRSFVMKIKTDSKARAIVKSIIFLAKSLNFETIAEGIETPEEHQEMRDLKADYVQGFLFSKAIPLKTFISLVKKKADS